MRARITTMPLDIESAVPKLQRWAVANPYIGKLWLFGSYAKGTAREDSDLDIAIEIVIPPEREGKENALAVYICEKQAWQKELQELLGFGKVQLEQLDPDGTPHVRKGVEEASLLVYTRNQLLNEDVA